MFPQIVQPTLNSILPSSALLAAAHEYDLARHAAAGLGKGKSLRDQRLDLFLLKEVQQGAQILSKRCRSQPLEVFGCCGDKQF